MTARAEWIEALKEIEKRLAEELKGHYTMEDAATLRDVECGRLTIGDLRQLAIALEDYLIMSLASAEKGAA